MRGFLGKDKLALIIMIAMNMCVWILFHLNSYLVEIGVLTCVTKTIHN